MPSDTGGLAAKAAIKAFGLDPEKDVVYIAIGAASVRMAAMDAGSVEGAIMPVPWNIRMKQKGFKELIFAGDLLKQPLTGIVTSGEKAGKNPQQVKKESGGGKQILLSDIVDYRLLKEAAREIER